MKFDLGLVVEKIKKISARNACFLKLELLIKTQNSKKKFSDNVDQNILKFDVLPSFLLITSETNSDY